MAILARAACRADVTPLLAAPWEASERETELVLGQEAFLLGERRDGFARVRIDDGYRGWVAEAALGAPARAAGRAPRIVVTALRAPLGDGHEASLGATFPLLGDDPPGRLRVGLPDCGDGSLPARDAEPVADARARLSGAAVVEAARALIGAPYLWGGTTARGIDCSGLVQAVLRRFGLVVPRNADDQEGAGERVVGAWAPGDLVCYGDHVAIWTGDGTIVHAFGRAAAVVETAHLPELAERVRAVAARRARRAVTAPRISWAVARPDGTLLAGDDAAREVPAASTIKVAVAIRFWREARAGRLDPDERVDAPVVGDGALLDHLPGLRPTLAHCATLMLAVSCNASTNVLLDRLGLDACDAEARGLGLAGTRIRRRMADAAARAAGRENTTTAADLASLLAALADPARVPADVGAPVRAALAASEHLDVLGEALRGRVDAVMPKRGVLDDACHDCALVVTGGRALGVAVCSAPAASEDALRACARTLPLGLYQKVPVPS